MEKQTQQGLPKGDWQSEESMEKPAHTHTLKVSKRHVWRLIRLGASLALTTTALVLTLIILVVGRHGGAGHDLALLTVDMSHFVRFAPPTIQLVPNTTAQASNARRGLGAWTSDIASAAGSAESAAATLGAGAASAVETAAAGAVAGAVAGAQAEADKLAHEAAAALADVEAAVTGLMDRALGAIQDALNAWLRDAAAALDGLDIPRAVSLHLTTACSTARAAGNGTDAATTTTTTATAETAKTRAQTATCRPLFNSGSAAAAAESNATAAAHGNGTIFGFQPGGVLAKALGVFFVPAGAQQAIRAPVDNATDRVRGLVHDAGSEVAGWAVRLLFLPIVAVYVLAGALTALLLVALAAATALTVKGGESVPPRIYSVCGTVAAAAAFLLFVGSVILTVVALVAYIVGLGGNVVGISVASGPRLKWISWAACIITAVVAGSLKVEEFVADCVFWWTFLAKLARFGKTKGGVREAMRDM